MTADEAAAATPVTTSARRRSKRMAAAITSMTASGTSGLRDAPVAAAKARIRPVSSAVVAYGVQAAMVHPGGPPGSRPGQ